METTTTIPPTLPPPHPPTKKQKKVKWKGEKVKTIQVEKIPHFVKFD